MSVLSLTPGKTVLFIDEADVQSSENVALRVTPAAKHPAGPILRPGSYHDPDSVWAHGMSIIREDGGEWRLYYIARSYREPCRRWRVGYAVSDDGIHWVKPRLGRHEFFGSKDNNILLSEVGRAGCEDINKEIVPLVFKDHLEPDPGRQYKAVFSTEACTDIYYSADGLDWSPGPHNPILRAKDRFPRDHINYRCENPPPPIPGFETIDHVIFFDRASVVIDEYETDPTKRYKVYGQIFLPEGYALLDKEEWTPEELYNILPRVPHVRTVGVIHGPDMEHLRPASPRHIMDPRDGPEDQIHMAYCYQRHGYFFLFYEAWRAATEREGRPMVTTRLAVSRDGFNFRRVEPGVDIIPAGPAGAFDSGWTISAICVDMPDRTHVYYTGNNDNADFRSSAINWETGDKDMFHRERQTGLAVLPKDGLCSLMPSDPGGVGTVTTLPVRVDGEADSPPGLYLNVSNLMEPGSAVRVELLSADAERPLEGCKAADCDPVLRDGHAAQVTWRGRARFPSEPCRVRFHLTGRARLHGFRIA